MQEVMGGCYHAHVMTQRRHEYWHQYSVKHVIEHGGIENYKIITIVRDPIGRNLSMFRQFTREPMEDFAYYPYHRLGIEHIPSEIERMWEIEVNEWFPPYTIYDDRLLVLRFENIDAYPKAIKEFTGYEGEMPALPWHGPNVRPLKKRAWFPKPYVDGILKSWMVRTFYTKDEIERMRAKWTAT